jgi:hypothetical protein
MSALEVAMAALRLFNIFISCVGILLGVDMIFGARILSWAGWLLNKSLAFDKALIKTLSTFKGRMDKEVSLEKAIFNTKIRFVLGIILMVLAGILYSLAK